MKLLHLNINKASVTFVMVIFSACFSCLFEVHAQVLTAEEVVKLTIENNFDIQIAKNNLEIAKNNNTIGNAGMLPQVGLNAVIGSANNNTNQKFLSGDEINRNNVASSNISSSIYATWTVFDGLKMFVTKDKLNEQEQLGGLTYQQTIENKILESLTIYYNMVSVKQYIKSIKVASEIAKEREELSEQKLRIGTSSNVEVFQDKMDLNNLSALLIKQENILFELQVKLNKIMKRNIEVPMDVIDTIIITSYPNYQTDLPSIENNVNVLMGYKNLGINELTVKELRTNFMPKIALNANYQFSRNENQVGFSLLNQNLGYNTSISASWDIFTGFINKTLVKNQIIQAESSKIELESIKLNEKSSLYIFNHAFTNQLKLMELASENVKMALQNLKIANEKFKQGLSAHLETREIQKNYEDAIFSYSLAAYEAKVSELNYLKVTGKLISK